MCKTSNLDTSNVGDALTHSFFYRPDYASATRVAIFLESQEKGGTDEYARAASWGVNSLTC